MFKKVSEYVRYKWVEPKATIKAIPIKSNTLCEKCNFYLYDHCKKTHCINCENNYFSEFPMKSHCKCTEVLMGTPCKYFKRKEGADNGK